MGACNLTVMQGIGCEQIMGSGRDVENAPSRGGGSGAARRCRRAGWIERRVLLFQLVHVAEGPAVDRPREGLAPLGRYCLGKIACRAVDGAAACGLGSALSYAE